MVALISFLISVVLSTVVIRVATVALTMAGISRDVAGFQALSAFTGVGFTTTEAEAIINHPLRRRIIALVIRLGNAGLITTVTSLLLTFLGPESTGQELSRLVILIVSLSILGLLASSRRIDRILSHVIRRVLRRWADLSLKLYDYETMLNLTNGYGVGEVEVKDQSWVAEKTLGEANLKKEGIIVLGIQRDNGTYIGAPHEDTRICVRDRLVLYGLDDDIANLDARLAGSAGDSHHKQAVRNQAERLREQDVQDVYSH